MAVSGIKRERITITIPASAYRQLYFLAKKSKQTVPEYVRKLVLDRLVMLGLPIYAVHVEEDS